MTIILDIFVDFLFFYFEISFLEAREKEKSKENAASHEWQKELDTAVVPCQKGFIIVFFFFSGYVISLEKNESSTNESRADSEEALTATKQNRTPLYKDRRGQI